LLGILVIFSSGGYAFSDDFEAYAVGDNILLSGNGLIFKMLSVKPPLEAGMVRRYEYDCINRTNILEHNSSSTSVITRLMEDNFNSLSGEVLGFVDIKPISGEQLLYFWQDENHLANMGAFIIFKQDHTIWASQKDNQPPKELGLFVEGDWYRVIVRMHIDSSDGSKSTYDVFINDIKNGRIIAKQKNLSCPGSPISIGGGQILSNRNDEQLNARFDNWSIIQGRQMPKSDDADSGVFLNEEFEPDSLNSWTIETQTTAASALICPIGQLSPTSVEIDKPDTAGTIIVRRTIKISGDTHIRITGDIQSVMVGPFAEYFMRVNQLDDHDIVKETKQFSFDDGITSTSAFGGTYKTPQTLGDWKTTRHDIQVQPFATKIELAFVFGKGQQKVRVDNIRVYDIGKGEQRSDDIPCYSRVIDSAAAFLDLSNLIPGYTYELTANTDTKDHRGFGVLLSWQDFSGNISSPQPLLSVKDINETLAYRFVVPEKAVKVYVDLYNSDLKTMGGYLAKSYRKWGDISIRSITSCPAIDTLYTNYIHNVEKNRELSKPRKIVTVSDYDRRIIDAHLQGRKLQDAQVKKVNGAMMFAIGDTIVPPMISAAMLGEIDVYSELAKRGLNIIAVENEKSGAGFGQWTGPEQFDFSGVDAMIYKALKQNPDAYIIFRCGALLPPAWWGDAHPDEILKDYQGMGLSTFDAYAYSCMLGKVEDGSLGRIHEAKYQGNYWMRNLGAKANTTYYPSPASRLYRQDIKKYMAALRRHIESKPYGKAVIGYHLTWGLDGQWGWPVCKDEFPCEIAGHPETFKKVVAHTDYSKPMLKYFREYLRKKYKTDQLLQKAWNDPNVTLETAAIPTPSQRVPKYSDNPYENKDLKFLLNPALETQTIDYNICYGQVVGDLLDELGAAMKAVLPRKIITAAYFQDMSRDMGHDLVVRGKGIDITGGPCYEAREVGQSGISPHLSDSYRLHGKIEFTEVDHRVFSAVDRRYIDNQVFETPEKSISILRREYARQMCAGEGAWTYDMGFGWYSQPILADAMGQIHSVFQSVAATDRSSIARMAVFIGDYGLHVMALQGNTTTTSFLVNHIRAMLSQSGAPVDVYRLSDLPMVRAKYKIFIFPFAYGLTDQDIVQINKIKKDGNLLVFGPGSGYVGSDKMALKQVEDTTGMKMSRDDDHIPWTVKIINNEHPITRGVFGFIGSDETPHIQVSFPMFYVTDPDAVALGEYVGTNKTGLAFKDHGTWQSVYIGAMGLFPPELLRSLARYKDLHVYSSDGDVMFFSKDLIAIHASTDGLKTLKFPIECVVKSLWDSKDMGKVKTIKKPMKVGENALYLIKER
jgi:hypothetical protein